MVTKRDKVAATLFEVFCIWPMVALSFIALVIISLAVFPVVAYYIIKKRWFGKDEEARKDLEDSRKGRRSY